MWLKIIAVVLILLVFVLAVVILAGANRWHSDTRELHTKMEAARVLITPTSYDPRELEGLPAPVQRYFRTVLKEGQPLVVAVSIEHAGTFNIGETTEQWKPFSSTQSVVIQRPGFIWDARIRMAPGMIAHVHDAYIAGEGVLTAKLFGLLTVMKQPNAPELAHGELMRFFAEAAWYPTALLPSQGVFWEAIDDSHASATLTDGAVMVKLVFQFDSKGLISSVRSDGRHRRVDGVQVTVPWQGRFWGYEMQDGVLVPLNGEVEWLLYDGPKPYWRGRIQRIQYELSIR
jgi:hypothetical protein